MRQSINELAQKKMGAKGLVCNRGLWAESAVGASRETVHRFFMGCRPSSQQDLLQLSVIAGELLVALAQLGGLAACVQDRGVVAAAEGLADLGKALLRELLGESHGDLPGTASP